MKIKNTNDLRLYKALTLWINTIWGILTVLASRQETRGRWIRLKMSHWKFYIKGVGIINKKISAKGKRLNIYIPRRANYNIKDDETYEIYLIEIEKLSSIDRNVIIYSSGRKARIEIPKWYLEDRDNRRINNKS